MLFQFFTYSWGRKFNRKSVIDRLDEYFPDAKFIMFVRNQETWIKSHYSQFLKGGGNIDFYNFIESILTNPYSEAHLIDWFPIVNYCTQKFGSENFRVWLYEELKEDPQKIADELCEYIGVSKIQVDSKPMNPSYNPNEMFAQITLNRLVKYSHGASPYAFGRILHGASPSDFEQMRHDFVYKRFMKLSRRICQAAGSLPPLFQEPMLSRDQKKRMREKYAMNNTKLGQLIGKDLKPYKYPIV